MQTIRYSFFKKKQNVIRPSIFVCKTVKRETEYLTWKTASLVWLVEIPREEQNLL